MNKRLNVIVVGSSGRMGREVLACLKNTKATQICAEISRPGAIHKLKLSKNDRPAIAIDFSSPSGCIESLKWCHENAVPFVSGTTGLSPAQLSVLKNASRKIPVFWSPNMSFGINLMAQIIQRNGTALRQYDLQIEEFHHRRKKDAPSGTAVLLQKKLDATVRKKLPAPISGRGGGIFGIHKLWIMGEEEVLTIEHTALNRRVFASGAVRAGQWLANKKRGFYSFEDLLK